MYEGTRDYDTLMRQAPSTIALYMNELADAMDQRFGENFSGKNPLLLGTLVQAAAMDYQTACHQMAADYIREGLEAISDALEKSQPVDADG